MQSPSTLPAYEALAHDIKRLGVDAVFGLMSDDTALFVTTLDSMGVRFHGARHENNAVAMAEGYAAATGRLGIAIIGRGPATANAHERLALRHAQRIARADRLRRAVDHARRAERPRPGHQGARPGEGARSRRHPHLRRRQTRRPPGARWPRAVAATERGAAALLLPMNVQFARGARRRGPRRPVAAAAAEAGRPAMPARPAIAAAAALLQQSRRPLIVAGLGAHRAGARGAHRAARRPHRRRARHHAQGQGHVPRPSAAISASSARSRMPPAVG